MLGFGSLPVTATAHLTQTTHHGVYDPMTLKLPLDVTAVPPGRHVPGFGPAPRFKQGTTFFSYRGVVEGTVNIRLSHITVDRVPLRVGDHCRTATPASLHLFAPAGYYPQNVPPQKLKGKPGEFQPLGAGGPGGYLQGTADVPAFAGCHDGGDNLDPLITGMISGPGNPVDAYSPQGLQSWCLEAVAHCSATAAAAQRLLFGLASGRRPLDASTIAALDTAVSSAARSPSAPH